MKKNLILFAILFSLALCMFVSCGDDYDYSSQRSNSQQSSSRNNTGKNDSALVNGMRAEFKTAMDSYEDFMDEYVEFMTEYNKNPSDFNLLMQYSTLMTKYAQFCEDFEEWGDEDLNDTELAYYATVQTRVSVKLLEITQ